MGPLLTSTVGPLLVDIPICCYGRAVVPRNAYGRREIEGLAIVEEPPRLVAQLVLLARGLLALGLEEPAAVGLCRRAALDSMPAVRRRLLSVLATDVEVTVSEAARRVGCHRHVARLALEELAAIGLAACPGLDEGDPDDDPELPSRWAAHPWRLAGPDQRLIRAVLAAPPWHEVWGAPPGGGEGEGTVRGGGVGDPHTSCQGQPATLADPSPARHRTGELVCPACGQLGRPTPGSPDRARCPDCAVDLVPVP